MPRHSRLDIAGTHQLVLQCSAEGRDIFRRDEDYLHYLAEMRVSSTKYACAVHAFALLPNEVYLLVVGGAQGAVMRMMQSLGRRYAYYANARDQTDGALWHGRYHSCLVGGDSYVVRAICFVDQSPERTGVVGDASTYMWSSHACHAAGAVHSGLVSRHTSIATHERVLTRRVLSRELLATASDDALQILMHVRQGCAWGSARFLERVARQLGERGPARPRGRPRKAKPVR